MTESKGQVIATLDDLYRLLEAKGRTPDPWWRTLVQQWSGPAAVVLIGGLIAAGVSFAWDISKQVGQIPALVTELRAVAKTAGESAAKIDNYEDERASRRSLVDGRIGVLDDRTEPLALLSNTIGELKGTVAQLDDRLNKGRDERVGSDARMAQSIAELSRDLAVVRTELGLMRRSLEARGTPPFLERPTWNGRLLLPTVRVAAPADLGSLMQP